MLCLICEEREREDVDNTFESRLNTKWRKSSNCYSYLIPSLTGDISSISIPSFVCTETDQWKGVQEDLHQLELSPLPISYVSFEQI